MCREIIFQVGKLRSGGLGVGEHRKKHGLPVSIRIIGLRSMRIPENMHGSPENAGRWHCPKNTFAGASHRNSLSMIPILGRMVAVDHPSHLQQTSHGFCTMRMIERLTGAVQRMAQEE